MSKEYDAGHNRIFGIDGQFMFRDKYTFSIEGVKSFSHISNEKNQAFYAKLSRDSDLLNLGAEYNEQAPNFFGNESGFYSYNNYRKITGTIAIKPRLESIKLRRVMLNTNMSAENFWSNDFFDKTKQSRSLNQRITFMLMDYSTISFGYNKGKEYDRFDYRLYPKNTYDFSTDNNKNYLIYYRLSHSQGTYRTGYSWTYNSHVKIRPNDKTSIELNYNKSLAKLIDEEGSNELEKYYYEVAQAKFYYHFNRDLNTRVIFQYNDMEKRLDLYYLLAYNFKPRSFLYIAYTERFDETAFTDDYNREIFPKFSSSNRIFQVKLSYLFLK